MRILLVVLVAFSLVLGDVRAAFSIDKFSKETVHESDFETTQFASKPVTETICSAG